MGFLPFALRACPKQVGLSPAFVQHAGQSLVGRNDTTSNLSPLRLRVSAVKKNPLFLMAVINESRDTYSNDA